MSLIDKVVAAVTPLESEEARRNAHAKAQAAAGDQDWLAMILQHHEQIDAAFAAVKAATDAATRLASLKQLGVILTGHANAEEAVIYPALIYFGHKAHGTASYTEQAGAKANMGELEYLDPMSQEFMDKLEHIQGAVAHHVYEEENDRFLDLKDLPASDQNRLTTRYQEEFDRYVGSESSFAPGTDNVVVRATLTRSALP
jgi:hemerythrin superfamily protein